MYNSLAQHSLCANLCWSIGVPVFTLHFGGSLLRCAGGPGTICGHQISLRPAPHLPGCLLVCLHLHRQRSLLTGACSALQESEAEIADLIKTYVWVQHRMCQNLCWSFHHPNSTIHPDRACFCCAGGPDTVCGHQISLRPTPSVLHSSP